MRLVVCMCCDEPVRYQSCLDILEAEFSVIEVVGRIDVDCKGTVPGVLSISGEDGSDSEKLLYDYMLILGDDYTNRSQVVRLLTDELQVDRLSILLDQVVCLKGFKVDRYKQLLESDISIISNNCSAGMLYHLFGMPFLSPTINMFQNNDSFLRFTSNLFEHLSNPLVFDHMEKNDHGEYPVFNLGDAELHMNHYNDAEKAEAIWYKRLSRLNPDNILVMMYTDKVAEVAAFHYLPFKKKVCFVPFPCDLPDVYPIPPKIDSKAAFWQLVIAISDGSLECYDLFDMLLYGEKNQIMDF